MRHDPGMLTTSTNRNLLQPTRAHKKHRQSQAKEEIQKGKNRSTSPSEGSSHQGAVEAKLKKQQDRSPSASGNEDRSQLVDLVIEDTDAEEAERVRARKEGSDIWNKDPQRHFVRTYGIDEEAQVGEDIREGYDPSKVPSAPPPAERAVTEEKPDQTEEGDQGQPSSQNSSQKGAERGEGQYANLAEEENVWK